MRKLLQSSIAGLAVVLLAGTSVFAQIYFSPDPIEIGQDVTVSVLDASVAGTQVLQVTNATQGTTITPALTAAAPLYTAVFSVGQIGSGADIEADHQDLFVFIYTDDGNIEASTSTSSLPVELTRFDAFVDGGDVLLQWETASETNNAGFQVQQAREDGDFTEVTWVAGYGTTIEAKSYGVRLSDLEPGLYRFRLKQVDFDGAFTYSATIETAITRPERFWLEEAYPNPFNPTAMFRFATPFQQHVRVMMYDMLGKPVRALYDGVVEGNQPQSVRILAGDLPSGSYLIRMIGESGHVTRSVVLAK
jgi:hypothetical protein